MPGTLVLQVQSSGLPSILLREQPCQLSIQAKVTLQIFRFFNTILPFFLVFHRVWHLITLKLDQGWVGHLNGFSVQGVRNLNTNTTHT